MTQYFGPEIGWFFAFQCQIISWIAIPSIFGFMLTIYMVFVQMILRQRQIVIQSIESILIPAYSIVMNLWATIFLEAWKRRQNEFQFLWDMHEFKKREQPLAQYQGNFRINYLLNSVEIEAKYSAFQKRWLTEIPIILIGLIVLFSTFFFFKSLYEISNDNLIIIATIGCFNGLAISLITIIYSEICKKVVEWENHKYQTSKVNSLIIKLFIFEFFNSYLNLAYLIVIQKKQMIIFVTSAAIIISRGIVHNLIVNVAPLVVYKIRKRSYFKNVNNYLAYLWSTGSNMVLMKRTNLSCQKEVRNFINSQEFNISIDKICDQSNCGYKLNLKQSLLLQDELEFNNILLDNKNLYEEYMHIAIQFGYITMFSPIFPGAPLFAFVNLYINFSFSLHQYTNQMKRETGREVDSIEIWLPIFTWLSYLTTIMNSFIAWFNFNDQLVFYVGKKDALTNAIFLISIEHAIIFIKFALEAIIPDVPCWIQKERTNYKKLEHKYYLPD